MSVGKESLKRAANAAEAKPETAAEVKVPEVTVEPAAEKKEAPAKKSPAKKTTRAKRGILLMKLLKSNPSKIIKTYIESSKSLIGIISDNYSKTIKLTEIPIMDRYSNGSYIIKDRIIDSYMVKDLEIKEEETEPKEEIKVEARQISLNEIDDKLSNIDSIIKDTNE